MPPATLSPDAWAETTFGTTDLGDPRRTARLVRTAAAIVRTPAASLPGQLAGPAALQATYRLLGTDAVDAQAILAPHAAQTREAATGGTVLLVHDTTELDFSTHHAVTDLGPIGNGGGQGLFLQTELAVTPEDRLPLGVLAANGHDRPSRPTRRSAPSAVPSGPNGRGNRMSGAAWPRPLGRRPPTPPGCMSPTGAKIASPSSRRASSRAPICWCGWCRSGVGPGRRH